jgi:hypothetical protein
MKDQRTRWLHEGSRGAAAELQQQQIGHCQGPPRHSSVRTRAQGHFPCRGKPISNPSGDGVTNKAFVAVMRTYLYGRHDGKPIHALVQEARFYYTCKSTTRHPNRAMSCGKITCTCPRDTYTGRGLFIGQSPRPVEHKLFTSSPWPLFPFWWFPKSALISGVNAAVPDL